MTLLAFLCLLASFLIFDFALVDFAFWNGHNLTHKFFKVPEDFRHFPRRAMYLLNQNGILSSSTLATALTLGAQTPSLPVSFL